MKKHLQEILLKVLVLAIAFLPDEVRRTSLVDPVQKNLSGYVNSFKLELLFLPDQGGENKYKNFMWRNELD